LYYTTFETSPVVSFTNSLSSSVNLYQLDSEGNRILAGSLPPGPEEGFGFIAIDYSTNPWVVTFVNGTCIEIFIPSEEGESHVNITNQVEQNTL